MAKLTRKQKQAYLNRVDRFIVRNEKMADGDSIKLVRLLKDAKNEVIQRIRNVNATQWDQWFLPQLRDEIQLRIRDYQTSMISQMNTAIDDTLNVTLGNVNDLSKSIKLRLPVSTITRDLVSAEKILTGELIKTVNQDLVGSVMNRISLGIIQGKSPFAVAKDISDRFNVSFSNASRIARTEILRTVSIVQQRRNEEIREVNPGVKKGWKWSHKPNGRPGHQEAEQTYLNNPIPIDSKFKVRPTLDKPFELLMYPRDPNGSAGNTIHCGCVEVLFPSDFEPDDRDVQL